MTETFKKEATGLRFPVQLKEINSVCVKPQASVYQPQNKL